MYASVIHAPGDVRYEQCPDPVIERPTDAVVRTVAACVCGSDLWRYRGLEPVPAPTQIGHEFLGVVEQTGPEATAVAVGDFVVGGFTTSDGTCPLCRKGAHTNCLNKTPYLGCQAERILVHNAPGTLVRIDADPTTPLVPSLLTLSDVMCTGWHAAVCAGVGPGASVAVVGDGAVGLCAVLASVVLGAERVIAMSRHQPRQVIARAFGATDVIAERDQAGTQAVRDLTEGVGADAVLECVGTTGAINQAAACVRDGGQIGVVGLPHTDLSTEQLFWRNVGLRGGPAPVRAYLDRLLPLVLDGTINPGLVFDLELPLSAIAQAYEAMDQRKAIKVLLRP